MIKCSKCEEFKDYEFFRKRPTLKRGYHSWCKECERIHQKLRYDKKPKKEKVIVKVEPEVIKFNAKVRMLKHRYKLDYDDYVLMYENQNKSCAICGIEKQLGSVNGLLVDHCHSTGKVRGLLCNRCNSAIGQLQDDITILMNAINYLNKNN